METSDIGKLVKGLTDTRHLFFTGKGGNGKTSLACATAITLAQQHGKRVLLVSTDPASNLDEVLGEVLSNAAEQPTKVSAVENLWAANIDPDHSATLYRTKVLDSMRAKGDSAETISLVTEQLSGQCTVEIAAFDEFAGLLSCTETAIPFDHIVFDTAPTGHTLRLLALPAAWTDFFDGNQQGASCLGPVSALKMQKTRFERALGSLKDGSSTTVYLVTRPEKRSIAECDRTRTELLELGIANQRVIVNGVLSGGAGTSDGADTLFAAMLAKQTEALTTVPDALGTLIIGQVPLHPFNMVGIDNLRNLLSPSISEPASTPMDVHDSQAVSMLPLESLVQEVMNGSSGLVMLMGKGGVGKTTLAVALGLALAERGCSVHLSTTDPAAHIQATLGPDVKLPNLKVSSVDPAKVTQKYIDEAIASRGPIDERAKALLLEDLNSPCTEEIAVFEAFSELIAEAQRPDHFVVLDTAPTGHTLLLMDATGAYDREVQKKVEGAFTPISLMQNEKITKVILATLPETTPISEAMRLRDDLGRAGIKPYAWILNQCLPKDIDGKSVLKARAALQQQQALRLTADRVFQVPLLPVEPAGPLLKQLVAETPGQKRKATGPRAPVEALPKIEDMDDYNAKRSMKDRCTAILFDASFAKDDLRVFACWLAAQVEAESIFSLDGEDDSLDDAVGEDDVRSMPTLCFYQGGSLVAKHTDIAGATRAGEDVMQVPAVWLQAFSLKAARAGQATASGASGGAPQMSLPADLRRAGVIGGC